MPLAGLPRFGPAYLGDFTQHGLCTPCLLDRSIAHLFCSVKSPVGGGKGGCKRPRRGEPANHAPSERLPDMTERRVNVIICRVMNTMALRPVLGRSGNRPACDPTERVFRGRDAACREGAVRPAGRKPFDPPARRDCSRRACRPRYQWARGRVPRSPAADSVQQVAWAVGHSFLGGAAGIRKTLRISRNPQGLQIVNGCQHDGNPGHELVARMALIGPIPVPEEHQTAADPAAGRRRAREPRC
jgi:hypothetical protein